MSSGLFPDDKPVPTAPASRPAARKAPSAFRTISETADELQVPQHVLRFWETKFPQLRPIKRGGGRRYYRPEDLDLLRRISSLLYVEGYTIKAVQRLLREGAEPEPGPEKPEPGATSQPALIDLPDVPAKPAAPKNAAPRELSPSVRAVIANILSELEQWRATLADSQADRAE